MAKHFGSEDDASREETVDDARSVVDAVKDFVASVPDDVVENASGSVVAHDEKDASVDDPVDEVEAKTAGHDGIGLTDVPVEPVDSVDGNAMPLSDEIVSAGVETVAQDAGASVGSEAADVEAMAQGIITEVEAGSSAVDGSVETDAGPIVEPVAESVADEVVADVAPDEVGVPSVGNADVSTDDASTEDAVADAVEPDETDKVENVATSVDVATAAGVDVPSVGKRVMSATVPAVGAALLACALAVGGYLVGSMRAPSTSEPFAAQGVENATFVDDAVADKPFVTVSWHGQVAELSARDVLADSGIDGKVEGSRIPSAETALTSARSAVIAMAAAEEGIKVDDAAMNGYVSEKLGYEDMEAASKAYGIEADSLRKLVSNAVTSELLTEKVAGESAPAPDPVPEGKDGEDADASEYFEYVKTVAGDDWDGDGPAKGSWVEKALGDKDPESKEGAVAVYEALVQRWSENDVKTRDAWANYLDGVLGDASVSLSTLIS